MDEQLDIIKYNEEVKNWQRKVYGELKAEIGGLGIRGKQELLKYTRHPAKVVARIFEEGLLKRDK
jgi:hypothetical protein